MHSSYCIWLCIKSAQLTQQAALFMVHNDINTLKYSSVLRFCQLRHDINFASKFYLFIVSLAWNAKVLTSPVYVQLSFAVNVTFYRHMLQIISMTFLSHFQYVNSVTVQDKVCRNFLKMFVHSFSSYDCIRVCLGLLTNVLNILIRFYVFLFRNVNSVTVTSVTKRL